MKLKNLIEKYKGRYIIWDLDKEMGYCAILDQKIDKIIEGSIKNVKNKLDKNLGLFEYGGMKN